MTIPHVMHHIWLGSPLPEHLASNIREWQRLHPEWESLVWGDKDFGWLQNQALFDRAGDLVPRDAVWQFKSDLCRYEILLQYGGWYCDTDTRPLRAIDSALAGHDVFAAMEDSNYVGNTYLGCTPDHPIMREIIGAIPRNVNRNQGKRPNVLTGPKFITPIWKRNGGYAAQPHLWYPYSYTHVKSGTVPTDYHPEAFAVHEWFHTKSVMEARRAVTR